MESRMSSESWPSVPVELKYLEFRLPGTFRELVASEAYTNEEIGRIVRSLALDTDYFLTPRIEPEVFYYRRRLIARSKNRKRVENFRKYRPVAVSAGVLSSTMGPNREISRSVTVTGVGLPPPAPHPDHIPSEETPINPIEKKPPIVPLEKKPPSSLEKTKRKRRISERASQKPSDLGEDLFSLVAGVSGAGTPKGMGSHIGKESQETRTECPQKPSEGSDGTVAVQDIERDSRPIDGPPEQVQSFDSRDDAAWIPTKFAIFWQQYPKKVAKGDAIKAFTKIIKVQPDVDSFMATLLASIAWWKSQDAWIKDDGKYVPYPATWLNRGNWEDSRENTCGKASGAQFLEEVETDDDLIRRMQGG